VLESDLLRGGEARLQQIDVIGHGLVSGSEMVRPKVPMPWTEGACEGITCDGSTG
jgi:hypothetical protein